MPTAFASVPLSEELIYRRCYGQMVRARPEPQDRNLKKVRDGELKGAQACMQLLERARLQSDGKVNLKDLVARSVLRTFQSLHSSWFPNHDLMRLESDFPTTNQNDSNEMGYHFTVSLLNPAKKFSEIVTSQSTYRGIRESSIKPEYFVDSAAASDFLKLNEREYGINDDGNHFQPEVIEFGQLIGIREAPALPSVSRLLHNQILQLQRGGTLGAGLLGTPTYIILSSTLKSEAIPDGELKVHRSWSKAIFQDLLCRSLPVIRLSDVRGVDSKSPLTYRQKSSCMQCHATVDSVAGVLRNARIMQATHAVGSKYFMPLVVGLYQGWQEPKRAPTSVTPHNLTSPEGQLYYRDMYGQLVDRRLTNLNELGQALAESDDLYFCAAKRYFAFFTGVEIRATDFSEGTKGQKSSANNKYIEFVLGLAKELKREQSLSSLIQKILSSDFYRLGDYGVES